ncbi:uncharacterized protein LOC9632822 isoform X1 [Selaginella moellendorffii]|uniref:uncharacterized protein LOC9632822 isoform X1 n=1 Tax=Selaginella moellendorffii TaxID=88036 RepID=UPI000D1CEAA9|nr:uncharacterized protein LOC9632822 isoform X1 [Selaginella moellendorffii]|eukprot:XP_024528237.1 uncharacterized protein LOC9632822 isoform X1 [Selaginella moellendorffii]
MARTSSGGGSRFASSNLNDLYGKQALSGVNIGSGGSKSRYLHGGTHGGMLVLARPVRTPPGKQAKPAQPKLTVPAPVNLPSLRKEHAGNDPSITLVGGTGVSGWSKQQAPIQQQQQALVEDPGVGDGHLKSNGWGMAQAQHFAQGGGGGAAVISSEQSPRTTGKYTPPAARGSGAPLAAAAAPVRAPTAVVLRGEDFPTLQAAAPLNPVPSQQRQREIQQRQKDKQREMKHQQLKLQQLSQNQFEKELDEDDGYKPPSPVLTLQPQSKQGGLRDESVRSYFSLKENRKPNDLSLRPGPLIHLTHTSNWADDERETASVSKPPDWEDPPRYGQSSFARPAFQRDERASYRRDVPEYGRSREAQDFGWDREGSFGRNDWNFGRNSGFDRAEADSRGNSWRMRDSYHHNRDSFSRESFFNKPGGDRGRLGARNGGFDLPVRVRSPYSEDTFMRDFPELPNLDLRMDLKYRMRRKREDSNEVSYRDLERESFETELERVQKEQEQERQRKIEERERAIELARKEEEERERQAREEEERQQRLEEEAREAAARAEQEALDSVRKVEEAKRAREEEKRKLVEDEERRKENARRKLLELEERIARREMEKKQPKNGVEAPGDSNIPATTTKALDDNDDRATSRISGFRMQQDQTSSRLRSPDMHRVTREPVPRGGDDRSRLSSASWRRDLGDLSSFPNDHGNSMMHSPGRRVPDEGDNFYGNVDGPVDSYRKDREDKWSSNGDQLRNMFGSPRPNNFPEHGFMEDDRRWSRRPRESRPFSPPSPTSYGGSYDAPDGVSYGRLRQSLPKQPRVLPPPTRTHSQKPSFSGSQSAASTVTSSSDLREDVAPSQTVTDVENMAEEMFPEDEACSVGDVQIDVTAEAVEADTKQQGGSTVEVSGAPNFEEEISETVDETVDEEQRSDISHEEDILKGTGEQSEFNSEIHEEVEHIDAADLNATLSELVDSIVVLPKTEVVEATQLDSVAVPVDEDKSEEVELKSEVIEVVQTSEVPAALLPSPLQTTQPSPAGLQQPFHHPPSFVPPQLPLLDSRPRMQGPMPDRPMTLQFGLLPGTSLLQGSIPAIQIGSIQMPLQLHPPIGHHVAHLQPPPQFQFGQIGQQAPLLPSFTVHPQAMMQPSIMNMDGQQGVHGQQFRMQPHPERTFWTHQYGQGGAVLQSPVQNNSASEKQVEVTEHDDGKRKKDAGKPAAAAQDSWKPSFTDGQTSGYSRFQEKVDAKQWSARHEGHSSTESFRKKPNRRGSLDFRAPNLSERGHYVPRKGVKGDDENEKSRQAAELASSERLFDHSGGSEEDDFIEVRSKRQLQKEKQVKSKPKHTKQQAPKQRNGSKPFPPRDAKNDSMPLANCLDVVVTTSRTRQASLSNPEVGFEKRTRSPQPTQINSLVPDAPAFPPIVGEGQSAQANGAAWGFGRSNQEVVTLTQIQLEEAMKPARFEVPLPLQVPLSEHLSSGLESTSTPSVTAKEKGPRPAAASGPVNSLLAGEKIQFGAVTMPAFASTVPWLGPSRSEGFLGARKELQDENELASFGKGKRSRENEDGTMDSEAEAEAAEAEAAASAVAVAAISNDDYLHGADQLVSSHGIIGSSNKGSPAGLDTQNPTQSSGIDETINVSLPADLSVDMPLRGPPTSGPHLPSLPGFPGLEMGTLLGGPVFAFGTGGEASRDSNGERPGPGGLNWHPRHGVDSFYGGPHGFAGPFINHGPIPSIPPHTLVYTSPFGGVGQFGQLGVSYMGPAHIPPVKQPDWKHTPVTSTSSGAGTNSGDAGGGNGPGAGGGSMLYAPHSNRHLGHDPSVISVVPPGPFDMYRDMAFQSQWSHVPGPHAPMSGPIPGFPPMHMRHPHPAYHMQHQADIANDPSLASAAAAGAGAPAEASDQYLDELGLGDAMSTASSDASNTFAVHQQQQQQQQHKHHQHQHHQQQQQAAPPFKPPSPVVSSLPAGSKLHSRVVVQPVSGAEGGGGGGGAGGRPNSGSSRPGGAAATMPTFQPHSYVATAAAGAAAAAAGPRRSIGHQDRRVAHGGGIGKVGVATGWSNHSHSQQGRRGGGGFAGDASGGSSKNSGSSSSVAPASKLKQVYVVKPPPPAAAVAINTGGGDHHAAEIFSADARHM